MTAKKKYVKHNLSYHPLYPTWTSMKQRCDNKNCRDYQNYGARGVVVCRRWKKSFKDFLEDVGERPNGKELDRINNDKGYEPGNIRWVTHAENVANRYRADKTLRYNGKVIAKGKIESEKSLLVIEIPIEIHTEIKKRAIFRNITMRKWVLIALIEQIKKEKLTE
jgi:hypothetical protein